MNSAKMEIPNADTHGQYEKAGYLQKMNGRGGFPYLSQWKRRYCILAKGRLFLYEKETSKGSDKSTNVVDLKYFDHVAEAHQKESKKVSNVFVVTSQDRTFFDPGRHLFAADTLTEMHDWVNKLRESIELIRNNNRPKNAGKRHHKDTKVQIKEPEPPVKQESTEQGEKSEPASKEDDTIDAKPLLIKMTEKKREEFVSALELKLRKESEEVQRSLKETAESQVGDRQEVQENQVGSNCSDKRSSSKIITSQQIPAFDIDACPQLESVTKNRIRGPAGRRAPQTKRNAMIKDRTNSMSTLQYDGQLENPSRSGSAQGFRDSTLTADGLSLAENTTTKVDISALSKGSANNINESDMNPSFDNIESVLFFKRPSSIAREPSPELQNTSHKSKDSRKSFFSFRYFRRCESPRDSKGKGSSLFRSSTFNFHTFRSKGSVSEHPDISSSNTRKCTIL